MANETARDRVWKYALAKCYKNGGTAKPGDIASVADVSERMARDCLLVMHQAGWLERRTAPDGRVEYICKRGVDVDDDLMNEH
jgi:CTP-dependent riboflavin kinase